MKENHKTLHIKIKKIYILIFLYSLVLFGICKSENDIKEQKDDKLISRTSQKKELENQSSRFKSTVINNDNNKMFENNGFKNIELETLNIPNPPNSFDDSFLNNYNKIIEDSYHNMNLFNQFSNSPFNINNSNNNFFKSNIPNYLNNTNQENMVKEEIILVPTPVGEDQFKKLKDSKDKKVIDEPRFLETLKIKDHTNKAIVGTEHSSIIDEILKNNTSAQPKAFQDIINSNMNDQSKVEDYIKLQEKDYDEYFKALNKMEYQKVFDSLNNKDMNIVYDKMIDAENEINYGELLKQNEIDPTSKNTLNREDNKKMDEMLGNYNKVLSQNKINPESNLRKSSVSSFMNGISLDNANYDQFSGLYNKRLTDKEFEFELNNALNNKNSNSENQQITKASKNIIQKTENINEKRKTDLDIKSSKDLSNYSKFRQIDTDEKLPESKENKKQVLFSLVDKGDLVEIMGNFEGSSNKFDDSMLQLINDAKTKLHEDKEKNRNQLISCKLNCDKSCKNLKRLRIKESKEVCKLKCDLACTNNILNRFMKK